MTLLSAKATKDAVAQEGGGWWGYWDVVKDAAQSVQEAANVVVEIYKEDLAEFAGAVKDDTEHAVEEAKKSDLVMKASQLTLNDASSFVERLVGGLLEKENEEAAGRKPVPRNRMEAKVVELQKDIATFLTDPEDEEFEAYVQLFDAAKVERVVATALEENPALAASHTKLVPLAVSYEEFWRRYFFREARLREQEERRASLIRKASESAQGVDELDWDMGDVDLTRPAEVTEAEHSPVVHEAKLDEEDDWKDMVVDEMQDASWTPIKKVGEFQTGEDLANVSEEMIVGWGEEQVDTIVIDDSLKSPEMLSVDLNDTPVDQSLDLAGNELDWSGWE